MWGWGGGKLTERADPSGDEVVEQVAGQRRLQEEVGHRAEGEGALSAEATLPAVGRVVVTGRDALVPNVVDFADGHLCLDQPGEEGFHQALHRLGRQREHVGEAVEGACG